MGGVGVNAMGQPQLISRLMAVKDEGARMRGFTIAIVWAVAVFTGMTILGLAGRAIVGGGQPMARLSSTHWQTSSCRRSWPGWSSRPSCRR